MCKPLALCTGCLWCALYCTDKPWATSHAVLYLPVYHRLEAAVDSAEQQHYSMQCRRHCWPLLTAELDYSSPQRGALFYCMGIAMWPSHNHRATRVWQSILFRRILDRQEGLHTSIAFINAAVCPSLCLHIEKRYVTVIPNHTCLWKRYTMFYTICTTSFVYYIPPGSILC